MTKHLPGFWPSELSATQAVQAGNEYAQLQVSNQGVLYWLEYCPAQQGRNLLVRSTAAGVEYLTPEAFSVRSRVHEYGGTSWCLLDQQLVFVNADDQQLYIQQLSDLSVTLLTHTIECRYLQPVWDRCRQRIVAVQELHGQGEVANRLVAISLTDGAVTLLHQGYDFYSSPVLNCTEQATALACIVWNHPSQPWLATQLCRGEISPLGELSDLVVVAGKHEPQAIVQPEFVNVPNRAAQLHAVTDISGNWQLQNYDNSSPRNSSVTFEHGDCATAPWQQGLKHWQLSREGEMVQALFYQGSARLWYWPTVDSPPVRLASEYSVFNSMVLDGKGQLYCVASSPIQGPAVIRIILASGQLTVVAGGRRELALSNCAQAEHLCVEFNNGCTNGFFYPPTNKKHSLEKSELPPLVVFLHGGPSAATYAMLNLRLQYWTQRGFAVLDLNYRGSTSYGREYRLSLGNNWGVSDVEDTKAAVQWLISQGRVHPRQCFIRGQSAGGYTALASLVDSKLFSGAASLYGVTEPYRLHAQTHKFESRYLDWLIGCPNKNSERYYDRAPLNQVAKITTPVIFFQGRKDNVVLPEQTQLMYSQLKKAGVKTDLHYFDDESHGFRHAKNQQYVLEKELAFYQKIIASC